MVTETDYIVAGEFYTLEDYLRDNKGFNLKEMIEDGITYYFVLDDFNEPTGEAYYVVSDEITDEELRG